MEDTPAFQALAVDGMICGLPLGEGACATGADLVVAKTDSADPVAPGQTFSYTVTVTNNGPDPDRGEQRHGGRSRSRINR